MGLYRTLRNRFRRRRLARRSPAEIFTEYVTINKWGDAESVSGKGSNLQSTEELRRTLPALLRELGVTSMLDLPCGDFHWMAHVDLGGIDYLGADIVPDLIAANQTRHARPGVRFTVIDLIGGPVPPVDLVFVRDCLVHLSNAHVAAALANIRASGSRYLLTTTFPGRANEDIVTGEWRALDLTAAPFALPAPDRLVAEGRGWLDGQADDKALGLWKVTDLPAA